MAITNDVSIQHNGWFLPGVILLTQCYYHRGTCLNAIKKEVLYLQPMIPPKRFDIFSRDWGVLLRRSSCVQFFFKQSIIMLLLPTTIGELD